MKSAALALAERGLVVFPCWPNRKTPICKHGFKEATTDREVITEWWSNHPSANIAVATGRKSGIFVAGVGQRRACYVWSCHSKVWASPPGHRRRS
jgi:Bifunctional DNA primase/polymerase, N-terminal